MLRLFAPSGLPITSVTLHGYPSGNAKFFDDGTLEPGEYDLDDFPNFEHYLTADDASAFVLDNDSSEWLERHCYVLEVDDDYDPWCDADAVPWPESVRDAAHRCAKLEDGVRQLFRMEKLLPPNWHDSTTRAVIDTVLIGRLKAEIAECEEIIAEHAKTWENRLQTEDEPCDP